MKNLKEEWENKLESKLNSNRQDLPCLYDTEDCSWRRDKNGGIEYADFFRPCSGDFGMEVGEPTAQLKAAREGKTMKQKGTVEKFEHICPQEAPYCINYRNEGKPLGVSSSYMQEANANRGKGTAVGVDGWGWGRCRKDTNEEDHCLDDLMTFDCKSKLEEFGKILAVPVVSAVVVFAPETVFARGLAAGLGRVGYEGLKKAPETMEKIGKGAGDTIRGAAGAAKEGGKEGAKEGGKEGANKGIIPARLTEGGKSFVDQLREAEGPGPKEPDSFTKSMVSKMQEWNAKEGAKDLESWSARGRTPFRPNKPPGGKRSTGSSRQSGWQSNPTLRGRGDITKDPEGLASKDKIFQSGKAENWREQAPEPTPTSAPEPTPTSAPEPTPTSADESTPTSAPEPTPTPAPEPTPTPDPAPRDPPLKSSLKKSHERIKHKKVTPKDTTELYHDQWGWLRDPKWQDVRDMEWLTQKVRFRDEDPDSVDDIKAPAGRRDPHWAKPGKSKGGESTNPESTAYKLFTDILEYEYDPRLPEGKDGEFKGGRFEDDPEWITKTMDGKPYWKNTRTGEAVWTRKKDMPERADSKWHWENWYKEVVPVGWTPKDMPNLVHPH